MKFDGVNLNNMGSNAYPVANQILPYWMERTCILEERNSG